MTGAAFYTACVVVRMVEGVLTICTNLVTIVAVHSGRLVLSPANILIANLAVADLLHGLTFISVYPAASFIQDHSLCLVNHTIIYFIIVVEVVGILFIAVERYTNLRGQLRGTGGLSRRVAVAMVLTSWGVLAMVTVLTALLWVVSEAHTTECMYSNIFNRAVSYVSASFFLFTVFLTGGVYTAVVYLVVNSQQKAAWNKRRASLSRRNIKLTKMLALVVGVYFILYMPHMVLIVTNNAGDHFGMEQAGVLFADINFWINPLIYAWKSKDFRKAFRHILGHRFNMRVNVVSPKGVSGGANNAVTRGRLTSVDSASTVTRLRVGSVDSVSAANTVNVVTRGRLASVDSADTPNTATRGRLASVDSVDTVTTVTRGWFTSADTVNTVNTVTRERLTSANSDVTGSDSVMLTPVETLQVPKWPTQTY